MNFEKKLFYFDGCALYQKHAHHFHYFHKQSCSLKTLQTITNNAPTHALLTRCHITTPNCPEIYLMTANHGASQFTSTPTIVCFIINGK